jgi:hypothetical protein
MLPLFLSTIYIDPDMVWMFARVHCAYPQWPCAFLIFMGSVLPALNPNFEHVFVHGIPPWHQRSTCRWQTRACHPVWAGCEKSRKQSIGRTFLCNTSNTCSVFFANSGSPVILDRSIDLLKCNVPSAGPDVASGPYYYHSVHSSDSLVREIPVTVSSKGFQRSFSQILRLGQKIPDLHSIVRRQSAKSQWSFQTPTPRPRSCDMSYRAPNPAPLETLPSRHPTTVYRDRRA